MLCRHSFRDRCHLLAQYHRRRHRPFPNSRSTRRPTQTKVSHQAKSLIKTPSSTCILSKLSTNQIALLRLLFLPQNIAIALPHSSSSSHSLIHNIRTIQFPLLFCLLCEHQWLIEICIVFAGAANFNQIKRDHFNDDNNFVSTDRSFDGRQQQQPQHQAPPSSTTSIQSQLHGDNTNAFNKQLSSVTTVDALIDCVATNGDFYEDKVRSEHHDLMRSPFW